MKKTYIMPEALTICLDPKMPILNFPISRGNADEGQFTKEHVSGDDTTTGSGSKSIWDEEW